MSRAAVAAFVAWRGLVQSPLATTLMVLAVAVGVAFQIPNSANLEGYEREVLRQGVSSGFGDVRVRPREARRIYDASKLVAQLRSHPGVTAVVPILTLAGAVAAGTGFEDAYIVGVDRDAVALPYVLARGEHLLARDEHGILLGSALAKRIGANVGSEVQLRVFLNLSSDLLEDDAIGRYTMTVRGIAAGGFVAPSAVFMDRGFLASELGSPDSASIVLVHSANHDDAGALASAIGQEHAEVRAIAWDDDNPFLNAAVHASGTINLVSYAMVMIAIVIPVWALLYISVLHRQRQIALLGAIGFTRAGVFGVFLLQAFAIGCVGALLGCAGGYALVRYFDAHPIFEIETFAILPARSLRTYLEPAAIMLAATLFAGLWPAQRASRLQPTRILRSSR